ncbi:hypothetical protein V2G26_000885 [Clonostachys chloroleuca]
MAISKSLKSGRLPETGRAPNSVSGDAAHTHNHSPSKTQLRTQRSCMHVSAHSRKTIVSRHAYVLLVNRAYMMAELRQRNYLGNRWRRTLKSPRPPMPASYEMEADRTVEPSN